MVDDHTQQPNAADAKPSLHRNLRVLNPWLSTGLQDLQHTTNEGGTAVLGHSYRS